MICKDDLTEKSGNAIKIAASYDYTTTPEDFGSAVDLLFVRPASMCTYNCEIRDNMVCKTTDYPDYIYIEGGNLKAQLDQERQAETSRCLYCTGDQFGTLKQKIFKIEQNDMCEGTLTAVSPAVTYS